MTRHVAQRLRVARQRVEGVQTDRGAGKGADFSGALNRLSREFEFGCDGAKRMVNVQAAPLSWRAGGACAACLR